MSRLSRGTLGMQESRNAALEADGFSFAQLRETYNLAGQLAFESDSAVQIEALRSAHCMLLGASAPPHSSGLT
jgi:hypothetical protein